MNIWLEPLEPYNFQANACVSLNLSRNTFHLIVDKIFVFFFTVSCKYLAKFLILLRTASKCVRTILWPLYCNFSTLWPSMALVLKRLRRENYFNLSEKLYLVFLFNFLSSLKLPTTLKACHHALQTILFELMQYAFFWFSRNEQTKLRKCSSFWPPFRIAA